MGKFTKVLYLSYTDFRLLMSNLIQNFISEHEEEIKKRDFINLVFENKNALLEMAKEFISREIELIIEAHEVDGILIWYKRTNDYSRSDDYTLVEIYSGEDFVNIFKEEIENEIESVFKDSFSNEKSENKSLE
jgi:predicted nucleic acid-binding protein